MNHININPLVGYIVSVIFFVGLILDYYFFIKKSSKQIGVHTIFIPWRVLDLGIVFLFYVFYIKAFSMLFIAIEDVFGLTKGDENFFIWMLNFIVGIGTVAFLFSYLKVRYKVGLRELGICFPLRLKWFIKGFFYYWAAIPPLLFAAILTQIIAKILHVPLEPQEPMKMFVSETVVWRMVLMSIFIVIVAPFFEEIVFRGFIYPLFKKRMGLRKAIVLSALLFASIHFSVLAFLPITCIGLFLAYLYEKTGSLFASITFHSMNNLMAVVIVTTALK